MKKYLKKNLWLMTMLCMTVCLCFSGCAGKPLVYRSTDTAMGTIFSQTLYFADGMEEEEARAVSQTLLSHIGMLEQEYLSWRLETSELFRINASAGSGQSVELSAFLSDILTRCMEVYDVSGGAFDFSIGSIARLWNMDAWAAQTEVKEPTAPVFLPPTAQQIADALCFVGADKCSMSGDTICLPQGMQLDLGAVGKGIALDEMGAILAQHEEITGAVISAGGSILTYGSKPDGSNWNVAIVNPMDTSKSLGVLFLSGQWCVSTSGDYERYVEVDGVRYHHILNPKTGSPADSGVRSVTVLTDNGMLSDALSTACFVLGVEQGLKLAEHYDAEALFVDMQGELFLTEGMKQYFHLSDVGN